MTVSPTQAVTFFPGDERRRCPACGAPLLAPRQGFPSLHPSLWRLYTLARRAGLRDLGTYNPRATLPGGGRSDHAYGPPAWAFDVGSGPAELLRYVFEAAVGRPEVDYTILEGVAQPLIWSRAKGGPRPYRGDPTSPHVHVSGLNPYREA